MWTPVETFEAIAVGFVALVARLSYSHGKRTGEDIGFLRGSRFARAEQENRWPAEPPPVIMYSDGGPHLPNDCGACARYVLEKKGSS